MRTNDKSLVILSNEKVKSVGTEYVLNGLKYEYANERYHTSAVHYIFFL